VSVEAVADEVFGYGIAVAASEGAVLCAAGVGGFRVVC
jgi:hypothetical protein